MKITEFLSKKNEERALRIMEESKLPFDGFIRWWSETEIQLDCSGLTVAELKKLVEIMEGFEEQPATPTLKTLGLTQ